MNSFGGCYKKERRLRASVIQDGQKSEGRAEACPYGRLLANQSDLWKPYLATLAVRPLKARVRRDLYRLPVFSCRTPLVMAWSIADIVG